jgi:hypothetical protein
MALQVDYGLGKLHKKVSNYRVFLIKGTDIAKRSIECMHLSKLFNVGYSVSLRSKSMTEPATRVFHVILKGRSTRFVPHLHKERTCHFPCDFLGNQPVR